MNVQIPKRVKRIVDGVFLTYVRQLPCCICEAYGLLQTSQTTAHHPIHGRYSQAKAHDCNAIPLCDCHHQGLRHDRDRTKLAIHNGKESWAKEYGFDHEWTEATQDKVKELFNYEPKGVATCNLKCTNTNNNNSTGAG